MKTDYSNNFLSGKINTLYLFTYFMYVVLKHDVPYK